MSESDYALWFIRRPKGWEWRNFRHVVPHIFTPGPLRTPPIDFYPLNDDPCIDTDGDRATVQCSSCGIPDPAYRMDDDGLCPTCWREKTNQDRADAGLRPLSMSMCPF